MHTPPTQAVFESMHELSAQHAVFGEPHGASMFTMSGRSPRASMDASPSTEPSWFRTV
jgi:hypothetical protein